MTATIEDKVQQGIDALDEYGLPAWRSRIDLEDLSMASGYRCVLGQIFGDFWNGVDEVLGIDHDNVPAFAGNGQEITAFMMERVAPYGFWTDKTEEYYQLNAAWRAALAA